MTRYAAFLRAVNLGKHRKASSADLKASFEAAGGTDVATFRTSGNVVFSSGQRSEARLRALAEAALRERLGMEVPVIVRSQQELEGLIAAYPFGRGGDAGTRGKPQVLFVADALDAPARRAVLALATDEDRLAFVGRDLCWWPKAGILTSEIDWRRLDQLLGQTTTRTLGTVEQLVTKFMT